MLMRKFAQERNQNGIGASAQASFKHLATRAMECCRHLGLALPVSG